MSSERSGLLAPPDPWPHEAIATALRGGARSGHERYVTLGGLAEDLYVLARVGEEGGRPRLATLRVEAGAEGVSRAASPEPP